MKIIIYFSNIAKKESSLFIRLIKHNENVHYTNINNILFLQYEYINKTNDIYGV